MKNIRNKYIKLYFSICENAENRVLPEGTYTEKHHIYPKSIYGENKNLIFLTAKEHYIVHLLLWKGFRKEYGIIDKRTQKMALAFTYMNTKNKKHNQRYKINNSTEYEYLKFCYIESQRNKKLSKEIKKKIGSSLKETYRKYPRLKIKLSKLQIESYQNNPERRKKLSKKFSGKNNPMYGKIHIEI